MDRDEFFVRELRKAITLMRVAFQMNGQEPQRITIEITHHQAASIKRGLPKELVADHVVARGDCIRLDGAYLRVV